MRYTRRHQEDHYRGQIEILESRREDFFNSDSFSLISANRIAAILFCMLKNNRPSSVALVLSLYKFQFAIQFSDPYQCNLTYLTYYTHVDTLYRYAYWMRSAEEGKIALERIEIETKLLMLRSEARAMSLCLFFFPPFADTQTRTCIQIHTH
jgi:hypothetical protein